MLQLTMFLRCLPFKSCRSVGGIYCLLLTRIFAKMLKNRIRMRSKQIASILTAFSGFRLHYRCRAESPGFIRVCGYAQNQFFCFDFSCQKSEPTTRKSTIAFYYSATTHFPVYYPHA